MGLLLGCLERRENDVIINGDPPGAIRADTSAGDLLDRALTLDKVKPTEHQLGKHVIWRRALLGREFLSAIPSSGWDSQLGSMPLSARRTLSDRGMSD